MAFSENVLLLVAFLHVAVLLVVVDLLLVIILHDTKL